MQWIVTHKDDIISVFSLLCALIVALIQVVKYIKYSKEIKMSKDFKQSFSKTKPEYAYDPVTKEIEPTGKFIDIQAQIDSYLETRLESILEKFLSPQKLETQDVVASKEEMYDDIDHLAKLLDDAEELRDKYELPDNMDAFDIYKHIQNLATSYVDKVDKVLGEVKKPKMAVENKIDKE